MYRVYFPSFGWYSSKECETLEQAVQLARNSGFQAQIVNERGECFATYLPGVGVKMWVSDPHSQDKGKLPKPGV